MISKLINSPQENNITFIENQQARRGKTLIAGRHRGIKEVRIDN